MDIPASMSTRSSTFIAGSMNAITSAITGVQPANYPHPSIGPSLGTPVGGPIQHQLSTWLPYWIKRAAGEAQDRTFEVFENLSTATTAADAYTYSLAFK